MKILIVKKDDQSILSKYDAAAPAQESYGGPWGDAGYCEHLAVPEEMDHECVEVVVVPESGEGEELIPEHLAVQEVQELVDAKAAAAEEAAWDALRAERDSRLKASDFTQLTDAPLTEPKKAEWAAYRQDLRDLPEETADPAAPAWPEEPAAE